jgi:hypothetical protein
LVIVLTIVMVPSQANVTVPPPAIAARRSVSVQLVTVPPAEVAEGSSSNSAITPVTARCLNCINERFADLVFVFIKDSLVGLRIVSADEGLRVGNRRD